MVSVGKNGRDARERRRTRGSACTRAACTRHPSTHSINIIASSPPPVAVENSFSSSIWHDAKMDFATSSGKLFGTSLFRVMSFKLPRAFIHPFRSMDGSSAGKPGTTAWTWQNILKKAFKFASCSTNVRCTASIATSLRNESRFACSAFGLIHPLITSSRRSVIGTTWPRILRSAT